MFTVFAFVAGAVLGYVAHQWVSQEITIAESWVESHVSAVDGVKNVVKTVKERL